MNSNITELHLDLSETTTENLPRAMRGDLLTGLALARRSLDNAKQDLAIGISIDAALITQLEGVVADYKKMIDDHDRNRTRKF